MTAILTTALLVALVMGYPLWIAANDCRHFRSLAETRGLHLDECRDTIRRLDERHRKDMRIISKQRGQNSDLQIMLVAEQGRAELHAEHHTCLPHIAGHREGVIEVTAPVELTPVHDEALAKVVRIDERRAR